MSSSSSPSLEKSLLRRLLGANNNKNNNNYSLQRSSTGFRPTPPSRAACSATSPSSSSSSSVIIMTPSPPPVTGTNNLNKQPVKVKASPTKQPSAPSPSTLERPVFISRVLSFVSLAENNSKDNYKDPRLSLKLWKIAKMASVCSIFDETVFDLGTGSRMLYLWWISRPDTANGPQQSSKSAAATILYHVLDKCLLTDRSIFWTRRLRLKIIFGLKEFFRPDANGGSQRTRVFPFLDLENCRCGLHNLPLSVAASSSSPQSTSASTSSSAAPSTEIDVLCIGHNLWCFKRTHNNAAQRNAVLLLRSVIFPPLSTIPESHASKLLLQQKLSALMMTTVQASSTRPTNAQRINFQPSVNHSSGPHPFIDISDQALRRSQQRRNPTASFFCTRDRNNGDDDDYEGSNPSATTTTTTIPTTTPFNISSSNCCAFSNNHSEYYNNNNDTNRNWIALGHNKAQVTIVDATSGRLLGQLQLLPDNCSSTSSSSSSSPSSIGSVICVAFSKSNNFLFCQVAGQRHVCVVRICSPREYSDATTVRGGREKKKNDAQRRPYSRPMRTSATTSSNYEGDDDGGDDCHHLPHLQLDDISMQSTIFGVQVKDPHFDGSSLIAMNLSPCRGFLVLTWSSSSCNANRGGGGGGAGEGFSIYRVSEKFERSAKKDAMLSLERVGCCDDDTSKMTGKKSTRSRYSTILHQHVVEDVASLSSSSHGTSDSVLPLFSLVRLRSAGQSAEFFQIVFSEVNLMKKAGGGAVAATKQPGYSSLANKPFFPFGGKTPFQGHDENENENDKTRSSSSYLTFGAFEKTPEPFTSRAIFSSAKQTSRNISNRGNCEDDDDGDFDSPNNHSHRANNPNHVAQLRFSHHQYLTPFLGAAEPSDIARRTQVCFAVSPPFFLRLAARTKDAPPPPLTATSGSTSRNGNDGDDGDEDDSDRTRNSASSSSSSPSTTTSSAFATSAPGSESAGSWIHAIAVADSSEHIQRKNQIQVVFFERTSLRSAQGCRGGGFLRDEEEGTDEGEQVEQNHAPELAIETLTCALDTQILQVGFHHRCCCATASPACSVPTLFLIALGRENGLTFWKLERFNQSWNIANHWRNKFQIMFSIHLNTLTQGWISHQYRPSAASPASTTNDGSNNEIGEKSITATDRAVAIAVPLQPAAFCISSSSSSSDFLSKLAVVSFRKALLLMYCVNVIEINSHNNNSSTDLAARRQLKSVMPGSDISTYTNSFDMKDGYFASLGNGKCVIESADKPPDYGCKLENLVKNEQCSSGVDESDVCFVHARVVTTGLNRWKVVAQTLSGKEIGFAVTK